MKRFTGLLAAVLFSAAASAAHAQPSQGTAGAVEFSAGYAGFMDDATIDHATFGGAARFYITRRLAIGPEIQYMRGPRSDRDLFVTGNLTFDVLGNRGGSRLTPFLVVGGGLMRHSDRFANQTFASSEGAFTAGGGVRVRVSERVTVGADARCGWEPHCRIAGAIGVGF